MNGGWTHQSLDSGLIDNREKENLSERSERHKIKDLDDFNQGGWGGEVTKKEVFVMNIWLEEQDNWQEMNRGKQMWRESLGSVLESALPGNSQEDTLQSWLEVQAAAGIRESALVWPQQVFWKELGLPSFWKNFETLSVALPHLFQ